MSNIPNPTNDPQQLQNFIEGVDKLIKKRVFSQPDYSPEDMASDLGVSVYVLTKMLTVVYGLRFTVFRDWCRIVDGKKRMKRPDFVMNTDFYRQVGFSNSATYDRCFSRYSHLSTPPRPHIY